MVIELNEIREAIHGWTARLPSWSDCLDFVGECGGSHHRKGACRQLGRAVGADSGRNTWSHILTGMVIELNEISKNIAIALLLNMYAHIYHTNQPRMHDTVATLSDSMKVHIIRRGPIGTVGVPSGPVASGVRFPHTHWDGRLLPPLSDCLDFVGSHHRKGAHRQRGRAVGADGGRNTWSHILTGMVIELNEVCARSFGISGAASGIG